MVAPRDVRILPKKGGWGAGPLTLPGGIGYQYTYSYLLTTGRTLTYRPCRCAVSQLYLHRQIKKGLSD